jgi:hypothetical protein
MGAWDFIQDELLGVDDFSRVLGKARKGDFFGAAKSYGTGLLELGSTVAGVAGVVAAPFTGGASLAVTGGVVARTTAAQAAKQGVKAVAKQGVKSAVKSKATVAAAKKITGDSAKTIREAEKAMRGSTTTRASEAIKKTATDLNPAVRQANSATKASADAIRAAEKAAGVKAPPRTGYPSFRPGGSTSGRPGGYPGGSTSGRPGGAAPGRGGQPGYPNTGGTGGYGRGGSSGGTGGGRGPGGKPGKVMPDGGRAPGRTTTIERVDAPSSSRPGWDPLRDTKPFDPLNNPKTNPWPGLPKVKPGAPKPAPAPRKPSAPPVKAPTKTPTTTSPWAPKSSAPDAIKPPTRITTAVAPATATQLAKATGGLAAGRVALFAGGALLGGGVARTFMPKAVPPTKGEPDKWVPSAIV